METLDSTEWPDIMALLDYWELFPPSHKVMMSIARVLGIEFKDPKGQEQPMSDDMPKIDYNKAKLAFTQAMDGGQAYVAPHLGLDKLKSRNQLPKHVQDIMQADREGRLNVKEVTFEEAEKVRGVLGI